MDPRVAARGRAQGAVRRADPGCGLACEFCHLHAGAGGACDGSPDGEAPAAGLVGSECLLQRLPSPFGRGAGGEGLGDIECERSRVLRRDRPHPDPLPKGEGTQCAPYEFSSDGLESLACGAVAAQPELLRRFLLSTRHECLAALPSAAAKVREALLEHALAHGKWVRIAGGERQPDALYAEWTVRAMQLAVRVCERAVFAALAALADFGMLRRERLLDARGRVRGLAYWLFPPPEKLTEAGKRRIRDAVRKKRARAAEEVGWATALGIDLDDDAADATAPEAKGEGR